MTRMSITRTVLAAAAAPALLAGCAGPAIGTATPSVGSGADVSTAIAASATDGGPTETTNVAFDGVRSLTISDDSGNVTVTAAPGPGMRVVKKIFANPTRPQEQVVHTGSDLRITAPYCASPDWQHPCRIDYEVQAPADIAVTLASASGNLAVTGLSGVQSAVAASGSVHVAAAGGPVNAQSTSGDVEVTASAVPQTLTATSVSGDVSVLVPPGRYRVQTATSSGTSSVTLTDDPGASALVRASTVSGDLRLDTTH